MCRNIRLPGQTVDPMQADILQYYGRILPAADVRHVSPHLEFASADNAFGYVCRTISFS